MLNMFIKLLLRDFFVYSFQLNATSPEDTFFTSPSTNNYLSLEFCSRLDFSIES